ncbi:MAG: lysophospholipase [Parasporobacterium sp.]|nr:lysophospholipase [Parasporobacterium sp.]
MKQDFYYLSADKETKIHASSWVPSEGQPRAVLQIVHGMVEYIGRYQEFAEYLAARGFYVTGNDHLGHGESVTSDEKHGYFHKTHGNQYVIEDIHTLRTRTAEQFPGVPYFMLGHSMGSFLLRQYIGLHGEGLQGVIIMGTGNQPAAVLRAGKAICRVLSLFKGDTYRSAFVNNMAFGSYNKQFEPARTTHDWLTKDTAIVDKYLADPWCTFVFTLNAYYHMFSGIQIAQSKEHIGAIPKDLPMLIVSGDKDPVGRFGADIKAAYQIYKEAGLRDLQMKLYPEDRHEILNELDRNQVYEDLEKWLTDRI